MRKMKEIKWRSNESFPLEMHKARVVQKLNLLEPGKRLEAIEEAGFNTFLLKNKDVFLDMLTDSGVNAMSDRQQAAMLRADDSYAGSETFFGLFPSRTPRQSLREYSVEKPYKSGSERTYELPFYHFKSSCDLKRRQG